MLIGFVRSNMQTLLPYNEIPYYIITDRLEREEKRKGEEKIIQNSKKTVYYWNK